MVPKSDGRRSGLFACYCVLGARPALSPIICHRSSVTDPHGVRHWLTFSFSVRARALRFQPASRPSGFCSRAFPASPCHCAVRLAAKSTSGSPTTRGSVTPGHPATRMCSTHRAPHCTPQRAAVAPKGRNETKATPVAHRRPRLEQASFSGGRHHDRYLTRLDDRAVGINPESPYRGAGDEQGGGQDKWCLPVPVLEESSEHQG
jgi:hypothetical protein